MKLETVYNTILIMLGVLLFIVACRVSIDYAIMVMIVFKSMF